MTGQTRKAAEWIWARAGTDIELDWVGELGVSVLGCELQVVAILSSLIHLVKESVHRNRRLLDSLRQASSVLYDRLRVTCPAEDFSEGLMPNFLYGMYHWDRGTLIVGAALNVG